MLNRNDAREFAPTPAPVRQPQLRRWLARRARQLVIVAVAVAASLIVLACGVALRRATCLIGLPDIGDPFDVAAFRACSVSDEPDAFVLFRQAANKLGRMPPLEQPARRLAPAFAWSKADPKLREWALANSDALTLFRQATERPDGIGRSTIDPLWPGFSAVALGEFASLALLEASRLEEQGDMAAAWGWYRAVLRMRRHVMRRGDVSERVFVDLNCRVLASRIGDWASDARTRPALIRTALEDAVACEPKPDWDAFSLKLQYLEFMSLLATPDVWIQQGDDEGRKFRLGALSLPPNIEASVYAARRFLSNEPERSRRVIRLAFANWLAHAREQDPRRRKPAVRATFRCEKQNITLAFYPADAATRADTGGLSPQDLASWLMTARDAKMLLQGHWPAIRIAEQRQHRALVVLLAQELYQRKTGKLPASENALVGPYLNHLPGDGSDEVDDGTAQTVAEPVSTDSSKPG